MKRQQNLLTNLLNGKERDEPKDTPIPDGTFRHRCDTEYIYTHLL